MKHIHFVDISTGEEWRKPLGTLSTEYLEALRSVGISRIEAGERIEIFPGSGYTAHGVINGSDWAVITISDSDVPIITLGICKRSRSAKMLLEKLEKHAVCKIVTTTATPPFCAIRPDVPAIPPSWLKRFIEEASEAILNA